MLKRWWRNLGWIKSSKRLPRKEDLDATGAILIYDGVLVRIHLAQMVNWEDTTHWKRVPKEPI